MADDKLRKLINRLLDKTRAAELHWSETPSKEAFQVSFPSYSVEVDCSDEVTYLRVYNSEGRIIDETSDRAIMFDDFGSNFQSGDVEKIQELYRLARRQALGVDRALEELLATLT